MLSTAVEKREHVSLNNLKPLRVCSTYHQLIEQASTELIRPGKGLSLQLSRVICKAIKEWSHSVASFPHPVFGRLLFQQWQFSLCMQICFTFLVFEGRAQFSSASTTCDFLRLCRRSTSHENNCHSTQQPSVVWSNVLLTKLKKYSDHLQKLRYHKYVRVKL